MTKINPKKIVISRTDSIGDVVLTLPLAGILKEEFPDVEIIFLGNTYTKPIINCSKHVDEVWEWATLNQMSYDKQVSWLKEQEVDTFIHVFPRKEIARLAKRAGVQNRIGTSHRVFHLLSCNHRPNFTRKNSDLHEAQLNVKLLAPLGIEKEYTLSELTSYVGFSELPQLPSELESMLSSEKKNVILHPKSQGSAVEWGVDNFMTLAESLDSNSHEIFITGTEKEAEHFRSKIPNKDNIHDLSGKMTLDELIAFISKSDSLVAASTGPLHIAGICNIQAVGLFEERRPIHSGRWQPLGNQVDIIKSEKKLEETQPLKINVRLVEKAIRNRLKKN
ncbi:MAG: heptosyltransferase-3 [Arenicella sp.]|jgi:heptosyltransferase-3